MMYLFVRNVFAYIHGLCRKSETRKKNFENLCKRFWIFDRKREYRKEKRERLQKKYKIYAIYLLFLTLRVPV